MEIGSVRAEDGAFVGEAEGLLKGAFVGEAERLFDGVQHHGSQQATGH